MIDVAILFGVRREPPDPSGWVRCVGRTRRYVRRSGFWCESWYLAQYPDVLRARVDPLEHYLRHGGHERRNPSPEFDATAYVRQFPEAGALGVHPLLHFLRHREAHGLTAPPVRSLGAPDPVRQSSLPPRPFAAAPALTSERFAGDDVSAIRHALVQLGYSVESRSVPRADYYACSPEPSADTVVLILRKVRPTLSGGYHGVGSYSDYLRYFGPYE